MSMDTVEFVRSSLDAVERGDVEAYVRTLAPEWRLIVNGAVAPMNRAQYVGLLGALRRAMPDMSIRPRDFTLDGEWVNVSTSLLGTHTQPFEVPGLFPLVPPSGKRIEQPRQLARFHVVNGVILEEEIRTPEGVDAASVYTQLGVVLPG